MLQQLRVYYSVDLSKNAKNYSPGPNGFGFLGSIELRVWLTWRW